MCDPRVLCYGVVVILNHCEYSAKPQRRGRFSIVGKCAFCRAPSKRELNDRYIQQLEKGTTATKFFDTNQGTTPNLRIEMSSMRY